MVIHTTRMSFTKRALAHLRFAMSTKLHKHCPYLSRSEVQTESTKSCTLKGTNFQQSRKGRASNPFILGVEIHTRLETDHNHSFLKGSQFVSVEEPLKDPCGTLHQRSSAHPVDY